MLEARASRPEGIAATIVRFWALRKLQSATPTTQKSPANTEVKL
jgi:hypothetical protein